MSLCTVLSIHVIVGKAFSSLQTILNLHFCMLLDRIRYFQITAPSVSECTYLKNFLEYYGAVGTLLFSTTGGIHLQRLAQPLRGVKKPCVVEAAVSVINERRIPADRGTPSERATRSYKHLSHHTTAFGLRLVVYACLLARSFIMLQNRYRRVINSMQTTDRMLSIDYI